MSEEALQGRDQPERTSGATGHEVTADPTQLLTGRPVGVYADHVVCTGCTTQLVEGRAITVYGYRRAESLDWDLRRCYCADCAPATIGEPTLGVTELLARAWLGTVALPRTRTHRLCLTDVEIAAVSPPSEGTKP
jgi:hypothetical protein